MTIRELIEENNNNSMLHDKTPRYSNKKNNNTFFSLQFIFALVLLIVCLYLYHNDGQISTIVQNALNSIFTDQNTLMPSENVLSEAANNTEKASIHLILPVSGLLQQEFNEPENDSQTKSDGIKIGVQYGLPVKAAAAGTVLKIQQNDNNTWSVTIKHDQSTITCYSGINEIAIKQDTELEQGDIIGTSGNLPVYFALFINGEAIDPLNYIKAQQSNV